MALNMNFVPYKHGAKSTHGGITQYERLHWLSVDEVCDETIELILNAPRRVVICKKVYCVELDIIFNSATVAESMGYGSAKRIRSACTMHTKVSAPLTNEMYHWLYYDALDMEENQVFVKTIQNDYKLERENKNE